MKGLIIIAACLALTFVLESMEKVRKMRRERVKVQNPDSIHEALEKYKDLME